MTSLLGDLFGVSKPIIAMLHLAALPGRPRHDRRAGMRPVIDATARDLAVLQDAGVDGLLFCNEADLPYQIGVGPEAVAPMAAVIGAIRREISRPFGVNLVWDPVASLAVARATGASFVREVFTGVFESDLGVIAPDSGDLAGYRQAIGGQDIALFTNITPEYSRSIAGRTVAERARGAAFLGYDALLISGPAAGVSIEMKDLKEARNAVPNVPLLANTGVNHANVQEILANCDGVIVGTSLKVEGSTWNPVDPSRARQMVELVGRVRARVPAR